MIVCAAVLVAACAFGMTWKARSGRLRPGGTGRRAWAAAGSPAGQELITAAELGKPLGRAATLVQFSTAFCAPCRATRITLAEVARTAQDVAHVEIDAESRLDLVRRLDVRRTPTVLVLGPDGRVARRATGQPRKADVIAALGEVTRKYGSDSPAART